eukprot:SM000349S12880  [mRNA]  locus=s349:163:1392:+ [translate_table: standard]
MIAAHHRLQAQSPKVATTRRRGTTSGGAPARRGGDTTPPRPATTHRALDITKQSAANTQKERATTHLAPATIFHKGLATIPLALDTTLRELHLRQGSLQLVEKLPLLISVYAASSLLAPVYTQSSHRDAHYV